VDFVPRSVPSNVPQFSKPLPSAQVVSVGAEGTVVARGDLPQELQDQLRAWVDSEIVKQKTAPKAEVKSVLAQKAKRKR